MQFKRCKFFIPQVEGSHRTWKSFLKYDLMDGFEHFMSNQVKENFDWVTALPVYQHIYNTTVHPAIGKLSVPASLVRVA